MSSPTASPFSLSGKVAVVTGASKGIGAEIARQLAAAGAAVVVNYASSREGADRVVAAVAAGGGRAVAVQADVAKRADVARLFAEADRAFGRLDVLVNNAGIYEHRPLDEIDEAHYRRQFDLNVFGLLSATREAARRFGSEGGAVVNVSSVVATLSPALSTVYAATKAAVDSVTRSLAKELAPHKIRVNSVNPGLVETEGVRSSGFIDRAPQIAAMTPLGRIGRPGDIAPAAVFLASPASGWVTGETLYVAGGLR